MQLVSAEAVGGLGGSYHKQEIEDELKPKRDIWICQILGAMGTLEQQCTSCGCEWLTELAEHWLPYLAPIPSEHCGPSRGRQLSSNPVVP